MKAEKEIRNRINNYKKQYNKIINDLTEWDIISKTLKKKEKEERDILEIKISELEWVLNKKLSQSEQIKEIQKEENE